MFMHFKWNRESKKKNEQNEKVYNNSLQKTSRNKKDSICPNNTHIDANLETEVG